MHYVYVDSTNELIPRPFYVGQGVDRRVHDVVRNRKHTHVREKHGLKREVVFSSNLEQECLHREIELIMELHTFVDDPLASSIACNLTPGGEGASHADDTKNRIRETVKAQWQDPEFRLQRQIAMRGKTRSYETRQRLSVAGRGRKLSSEAIMKRSATNRGSKRPESTRRKMSEARRLWWQQKKGEAA